MCFFAGGLRFSEEGFGISSTCPEHALFIITLRVIGVLLPAAFHNALQPTDGGPDPLTNTQEGHDILSITHGVRSSRLHVRSQYAYLRNPELGDCRV
ncbi:hypothetical protein BC827DRAFT_1149220 [Russula dissimulans]|nr:hypothetical protein BC827DRAFT_1149220 [Russula dissimulans]